MSLTSRVANLFTSGSTGQDRNNLSLFEDGLSGGKETFSNVGLGREVIGSQTMAPEALEEEGRPPYLHVSYYPDSRYNAHSL